jgi:phosphatidylserine/phosphatidylglycerophosphate/cardiolipin synthase-like enzyme
VWRVARVDESAVIVDAEGYFKAFYQAALRAERYILIAGWQFDTEVSLLRGRDAERAQLPVRLRPFLNALLDRTPHLQIYLLAWDFSVVYAIEREWLQEERFGYGTPDRMHFVFDEHPKAVASHHQKFVVIDGKVGFVGSTDLCDARWDDREHAQENAHRVNLGGEPGLPNHEVQAGVSGEAAEALVELFQSRWRDATGAGITLPEPPSVRAQELSLAVSLAELKPDAVLPMRANQVGIVRTAPSADGAVTKETFVLFTSAIAAAERFIYLETQYFTSRSIAAAFVARLSEPDRPKLELVLVLPKKADSSKEKFALGEAQNDALGTVEAAAQAGGHEIRFLCTATACNENDRTTFIHSKVLIVDDRFLSVGSANLTERSMGLDSELSLIWEAEPGSDLERDIRHVRASLLAEHSERDGRELEGEESMVSVVDRWMGSSSRLRRCHFESEGANVVKNMIFDPGGPNTIAAAQAVVAAVLQDGEHGSDAGAR